MSPFENADYTEEVSINNISGLDFTNMANNEIIRKTSDTTAEGSGVTIIDEVAGEFYIKKIFNFINVPPFNILLGGILNSYNILTSSYKTQIAPKSSSIGSSQGLFLTSTVLDGNIKVGINISEPEEELEIDGNIQIDSGNQARLKFQKSGGSPHALGEIDGEEDGTNGGDLQFYTKVDGGSVTEKLRINNKGAIGVGGANFGNDGQFLMSKGNAAVPVWSAPTASLNAASFALVSDVTIQSPNTEVLIAGQFTPLVVNSAISNNNNGTFTFNTSGTYLINCSLFYQRTLISPPYLLANVYLYLKNDPLGVAANRTTLVESTTNTSSDQYLQQEIDYSYVNTFNASDVLRLEGRCDDNFIAVGIRNTTITRTHINFIRLS